ncbi:MAG TPA: hypothetical protein VL147_09320 [Devosia sp.]|nr:hypothetical protein [Devosia sp.]
MTTHLLPPHRRAIGFVFPAIILVMALVMVPIFISAGLAWWPLFILGPAAALALLICVEWRAIAISFDTSGVHYRAVGYRIDVPWFGIKFQANGNRPVLYVTEGQHHWFPWLGVMFNILNVFNPYRASHASGLTAIIPLYYFLTGGDDDVMTDLRAMAPAGFL